MQTPTKQEMIKTIYDEIGQERIFYNEWGTETIIKFVMYGDVCQWYLENKEITWADIGSNPVPRGNMRETIDKQSLEDIKCIYNLIKK